MRDQLHQALDEYIEKVEEIFENRIKEIEEMDQRASVRLRMATIDEEKKRSFEAEMKKLQDERIIVDREKQIDKERKMVLDAQKTQLDAKLQRVNTILGDINS